MKHTPFECPDDCAGCWCCDGGLTRCTVCGGAEGSLPTDCPGSRMDDISEAAVYSGRYDFINGKWVVK